MTTTATIVTPVYNEDPVLFRRALDPWIANGPDRIIAVVDVTDTRCMEIAHGYPDVEVIPIDIPGKRPALAAGVDATTTDIVVLVDSDVIWEPDVLAKLKMPFADPAIGGVGTRQHMYPTDGVRRRCGSGWPISISTFATPMRCRRPRAGAARSAAFRAARPPIAPGCCKACASRS